MAVIEHSTHIGNPKNSYLMPDNNKPSSGKTDLKGQLHPASKCVICGSPLYCTDHGNHEITYHCSSNQARFWDYERGSNEELMSKDHWDRSKLEEYPAP